MTVLKVHLSLLGLFWLFSTIVDATSKETLTLKVFSPDDRPSDEQLKAMLKKADLEKNGYKKELTRKLVRYSGVPLYQKAYLYYKMVNCSRLQEITQELETLMPVSYLIKLGAKFNREAKARNLSNMKQCKVGLEIHFKDGGNCAVKKTKTRRQKRGCFCIGTCISGEAEV
ncbi:uncharacterized protein [Porites lutea]|uniref:uncharacterized protein n=1 Tax=Porites lutea TaxID=51062 RepID=UPI003CC6A834